MANLLIDAIQAVGVASATPVIAELTDQRGAPVVGYVTASNEVLVLPTTVTTDDNGQVTLDLIPNADITPGNTCYTIRIAGKQFLIQKSAVPQSLLDALVVDPGELDPIEAGELQDHINDPTGAHFASAIGFDPYLTLTSTDVQGAIEELYDEAVTAHDEASEISFVPTGDLTSTNVQDAIVEVDNEFHTFEAAIQAEVDADEAALAAHLADTDDAHDASAISVVPFSTISATNVQAALEEVLLEATPDASEVVFAPAGDIVATNVQAAIEEVDAEFHAHEADATDAHDASAISVVPVNVLDTTDVQSALAELGESFSTPKTPSGFPNTTSTTISLVDAGANLTFTIAPTGASFDVWLFGDKFTKTSESVSTPDGLDRVYYFYYDSAGTLSVTTNVSQPTGFDWATQVPVAIGFRNSTGNDLVLFDTRHGLSMDWATRGYLHRTRGSQLESGLVLSGYTLSPGSPVDADNTWALSSGVIVNEDLTYNISAIADGGPYTTLYKSGAGSFSTATSFGASVPFALVAGDLAYNLNTAGSYSLAAVPNGSFVNYFIFVTGSVTSGYSVFAFPEETVYASQALAEAAPIASPFTAGGFAFSEFFQRYRVTYQRSNAYTTTGRCRTVAVTQITNSQTLITTGSTPTSHGSLTGRDVADQHPALAITNTPSGTIAATDVQSAINELATDKVEDDGSYTLVTDDVLSTRLTGNANPRFTLNADGSQEWGNGTASLDTNLYRSNTDQLKTDDSLWVAGQVGIGIVPTTAAALTLPTGTAAAQGILFDGDTNLYRSAANTLRTDDSLSVGGANNSIGTTPLSNVGLNLGGSVTSAGIAFGIYMGTQTLTPTTGNAAYFQYAGANVGTGASNTVTDAVPFFAATVVKTGTGTITNAYGFYSLTQTAGTNNYGMRLDAVNTASIWCNATTNATTAAGGIHFGSSRDTNIYRSAANTLTTDDTFTSGAIVQAALSTTAGGFRQGASGPLWLAGTGTPEAVVTAPVGSLFSRTDGGAATTLYVKESGTGNTGWVAK